MKILFVIDRRENAGSIQAIAGFLRAGDAAGHEMALFGLHDPRFPALRTSTEVAKFDHVVFLFESSLQWLSGLKLSYMLQQIPRERRAILDADGMYNDVICIDGYDRNHDDESGHRRWRDYYDALADRIFQPTFQPLQPNVSPLLFYGYDPSARSERCNGRPKPWDVLHVGHNWWRWRQVGGALMPAIERIRSRINGVCFVGAWWDAAPSWAGRMGLDHAFDGDPELMRRLDVQIAPPIPFEDVIPTMSESRVNVMTQRPLFQRMRFVTSKYFEIFCADTVPLVMLPPAQAEQVYGPAGRELSLHDDVDEKLLDVLGNPRRYDDAVQEVRRHLEAHHSYERRVTELVEALEAKQQTPVGATSQ